MPFGVIGRTCLGMRQVVGFGDRSTRRGTFGVNLGRAIVTIRDLLSRKRDSLPKLLWAHLFYYYYYYCAALLRVKITMFTQSERCLGRASHLVFVSRRCLTVDFSQPRYNKKVCYR